MVQLRDWQVCGLEALAASDKSDFLVAATPGAGKTTFALTAAKMLNKLRGIRYVFVVAHTNAIREQWLYSAARAGLQFTPLREPEDMYRVGFRGCVVTYQQIASGHLRLVREACQKRKTLMIADEIHHAGDSRSWGDSLLQAFGRCDIRLCLTGTPWRRNTQERIPFVAYVDTGRVVVDYAYGYTDAIRDGVCRPIDLLSYTGDVSWTDKGRLVQRRLDEHLEENNLGVALKSAFDPENTWISGLLQEANNRLTELRGTVPDAGGLVVAGRQDLARKYAQMLRSISGEPVTVVLSDDGPEAREALDKYKKSKARWLCAVNMISEGVDVPRLCLGVYATNVRTPLFFRQVVGRFVRKRPAEVVTSALMYPQIGPLVQHAEEIEQEIRHALEPEEPKEDPRQSTGAPRRAGNKVASKTGEPVLGRVITSGDKAWAVPDELYTGDAGDEEEPRYVQHDNMRRHVDKLVKACAARMPGRLADNAQRLNRALRTRYGPRQKASPGVLQRMIDELGRRLDDR
jgi:superfamily II DNA or RNA helicase